MHIALVIDDERLHREHSAINRLSIALIADGAQVTRVVPDTLVEADPRYEQMMGLARRYEVAFSALPWMRRARCMPIIEDLQKSPVEIVHVIGAKGWNLGRDLSAAFECPVSLALDRGAQVLRVPRGRGLRLISAYIAPTQPMAEALQLRVDSDLVSFVPAGVAIPQEPRFVLDQANDSIAVAILGRATDLAVYRAMLDALSRLTKRYPQMQLFLELPSARSHEIWRHAQRVGLLPRMSAMGDAADHRELITRCDLALLPESGGAVRSVTLELLALGVPVIATQDPWLDYLIEGETAAIVGGLEVDEWDARISILLEHPDIARAHGLRARQWASTHRSSSAEAAALLATLSRAVTGTTLSFEAAATT